MPLASGPRGRVSIALNTSACYLPVPIRTD